MALCLGGTMNVQGEGVRWNLPLPDSIRDKASKALSTKMGEIEKRLKELTRASEAATGLSDITNRLGMGNEAREIKRLKAQDAELFETFSAIRKGPNRDATLSELISEKKNQIKNTPKGQQKTALQTQLKGLLLIKEHLPNIDQEIQENKYLGRPSALIDEPRDSIDEPGLEKALKELESEHDDSLLENLTTLDAFRKILEERNPNLNKE